MPAGIIYRYDSALTVPQINRLNFSKGVLRTNGFLFSEQTIDREIVDKLRASPTCQSTIIEFPQIEVEGEIIGVRKNIVINNERDNNLLFF